MGYVKSMIPDDWDSRNMAPYVYRKYKYLCRGGVLNPNIRDKWLPRWYDIPFEDCLFSSDLEDSSGMKKDWEKVAEMENVMLLTDLPKGTNYKQHLKILKTERVLNGNDVR